MAQDCFLFYTETEGITGESTVTEMGGIDTSETSEIMQASHSMASPRDRASGQATGRRFHEPLRVLKRIDKATPLLFKALATNQILGKLELKWFRPNPMDGSLEHFFTMTIQQATVVKLAPELPFTRNAQTAELPPMEWVDFVYQKITYTHVVGNTEHEDDWASVGGR
jgi:type VI secretion system secreted protein Hcp